jgi:hypothetical protein
MNGWDVLTWMCSAGLALTAVLIFGFFLRDAGAIIRGEGRETKDSGEQDTR